MRRVIADRRHLRGRVRWRRGLLGGRVRPELPGWLPHCRQPHGREAGDSAVASLAAVWLALVLALGTAAAGGPLSGFLYPDSLDDELAMECELVLRGARRDGLPLRFTVAASDGEAVMAEVCAVAQAAKARKSRRASA